MMINKGGVGWGGRLWNGRLINNRNKKGTKNDLVDYNWGAFGGGGLQIILTNNAGEHQHPRETLLAVTLFLQ